MRPLKENVNAKKHTYKNSERQIKQKGECNDNKLNLRL